MDPHPEAQAVCNALALDRGCPHGPQGSRRSGGLVHKSTAQGALVPRALGPGDFLQPLDNPSSLPAGGPRSPAPNRSGRWTRTDRAERPATRPISGDPDIDVLRRQVQALDAGMHLRRRQTVERRVRAFVVVQLDSPTPTVPSNARFSTSFTHGLGREVAIDRAFTRSGVSLSANIVETSTTLGISVGRWR